MGDLRSFFEMPVVKRAVSHARQTRTVRRSALQTLPYHELDRPVDFFEFLARAFPGLRIIDDEELECLSTQEEETRVLVERHIEAHVIEKVLSVFSSVFTRQEREVLKMRSGVDNKGERALEEIAAELKTSREEVCKIEERALVRVRRMVERMGSEWFADESVSDQAEEPADIKSVEEDHGLPTKVQKNPRAFAVPEELFQLKVSSGERKLAIAVLENALLDYTRYKEARYPKNRRLYQEAKDWLLSNETFYLHSFLNICAILGFDPKWIHEQLPQGLERISQRLLLDRRYQRKSA